MVIKKSPAVPPAKMTGARYAFLSMETTLSIGATSSREEGAHRRIYLEGNTEVASMELVGESLIVDFAAPTDVSELAAVMPHYRPTPKRKGWLRFERPATRDPRPGLEASLGGMLGAAAAQRKRKQPNVARPSVGARKRASATRQSIHSGGGPYIAVPKSKLDKWHGAEDAPEAYQALAKGGDGASLATIARGLAALVIGTPDRLLWSASDNGGVLVSVVSFDADDDAVLEAHLAALPDDGWVEVKGKIATTEPLWIFDSAAPGGALSRSEALELELGPGQHAIEERTWKPDASTELFLVRLSRAGA